MQSYVNQTHISKQHHNPFGMLTVGRSWQAGSEYKYGFNGKENDDEIAGNNNDLDFRARIYDSRLGRWNSVDPLTKTSAAISPYSFAINYPILFLDPDGKKETIYLTILNKDGSTTILKKVTYGKFYSEQYTVRSSVMGIDTHSETEVYDIYDYEVNATLDLRGDEPSYTIEASAKLGDPIIEGVGYISLGNLKARQKAGEYGGTMFSASNGQGEETKIGDPDAIVNIDLVFQAAQLNKPQYSSKQIFQGTKYLKTLGKINDALNRTNDVKKLGELVEPTINSIEDMVETVTSKNRSTGTTVKVCKVCSDTLDVNDNSEGWHPRFDTIEIKKIDQ